MKNILVVGINTRPVTCSAKKMGHTVYSVDYFCTRDLVKCSDHFRCILNQLPYESCGNYKDNYDQRMLQKYADEVLDDVDHVICSSGAVPENFPESKVLGNKKIMHIENKYNLYKLLKNKFRLPETFLVSSYMEAVEIANSFEDRKFIIKPVTGAGGNDIRYFEETTRDFDFSRFMLQEFIEGESISASVLSTKKDAKTILTSRQIIGNSLLGAAEEFAYCGNIAPYSNNAEIKNTASEVIIELGLVGSNGVDMIERNGEIFIIEVNPRFQGTLECAEEVLGLNMFDAHFKACEGTIVNIPEPEGHAVKMIIFARWRLRAGDLNFKGVYDIPRKNVIIEKGEPVATVVTLGETAEDAIKNAQKIVNKVYSVLYPYPQKILSGNISA